MPKATLPLNNTPRLEFDDEARGRFGFLEDVAKQLEERGLLAHRALREDISRPLGCYALEVVALDSESMCEVNLAHRGKDSSTDVLSFPLEVFTLDSEISESSLDTSEMDLSQAPLPAQCLGSVLINYEFAQEVATKLGHSFEDEVSLLFIHGLLHILGFDHECDNGQQRALEQQIIRSLNLPDSLIVRTESEAPR